MDEGKIKPQSPIFDISGATMRNWARLNPARKEKLTTRANKRLSKKQIVPVEYFTDQNNIAFVRKLIGWMNDNSWDTKRVLYSVAVKMLQDKGILHAAHVQSVLREFGLEAIPELSRLALPADEWDLLGLIYQSAQLEGKKNATGAYYTPRAIVSNMIKGFDFSSGQTFLDPCCGSGSFLLAAEYASPGQLFGFDNDPAAVMTAKVNLLLRYHDCAFAPQVFCLDYLRVKNPPSEADMLRSAKFNYIATNPPWGAVSADSRVPPEITSGESFSCFFVNAFRQLRDNGTICFLFPESILKVKAHKDIRTFLLNSCRMERITAYDGAFSGVTTKYVDITCKKERPSASLLLSDRMGTRKIRTSGFGETENRVFCFLAAEDMDIIHKIKSMGQYDLSQSVWALGIITGDNKNKLKHTRENGCEAIYTGKEIARYTLKPAGNYLLYDRSRLQQAAREEYYRADEKLVYKFISNKPVFAYDDSKSLFLNSANILIPNIPHMGIKTVMAFLNSELFQYLYLKMFGEVKILKGNLTELPFPEITEEQNRYFERIVDDILGGDGARDNALQSAVYAVYDLSEKQIFHIRRSLAATIHKRA